jgi:hypothetical protein
MQCEIVADARGLISRQELASLSARSLNPVSVSELENRYYNLSRLPGGYLFGVREVGGGWLGLIGGWHQGATTILHWQLNIRGYEKDSLVNVVRSYFLEHEVQRGARKLVIYGGTLHSMGHSFEQTSEFDLVVRRHSLRSAITRFCFRMYLLFVRDCPAGGFIRTFTDDRLQWSYLPSPPSHLAPLHQVPGPTLE